MNFIEHFLREKIRNHEWSYEVVKRLLNSENLDSDELNKLVRLIRYGDVEDCIIYKCKTFNFTTENWKRKFSSNLIISYFFFRPDWLRPAERLAAYNPNHIYNSCGNSLCINNNHSIDRNESVKDELNKPICYISNYSKDEFAKLFTLSKDDKCFEINNNDSFLIIDKESPKNLNVIFELNSNKLYRNILDLIGIKLKEPDMPISFMNFSNVIICNNTSHRNQTSDLNRLADFFKVFCAKLCFKEYFFIKNDNSVLESIIRTENLPLINNLRSESKAIETIPKDCEVIKYAMSLIKTNTMFSIKDIQYGIFPDCNNNSTSLTQKAFDQEKIKQFKSNFIFWIKFIFRNLNTII